MCHAQENHPPYGLCAKPHGCCVITMHDNRDAEARGALLIGMPQVSSGVGRIKKTMLSPVGAEERHSALQPLGRGTTRWGAPPVCRAEWPGYTRVGTLHHEGAMTGPGGLVEKKVKVEGVRWRAITDSGDKWNDVFCTELGCNRLPWWLRR